MVTKKATTKTAKPKASEKVKSTKTAPKKAEVAKKEVKEVKEAAVPKKEKELSGKYFYAVGKRKTSIAQVRLFPVDKAQNCMVNGKEVKKYFTIERHSEMVDAPLKAVGMEARLPDDKVLIAGDVLVNTTTPNFRDAETKKWVQTLADLQQFPAKTIIPGHGPLMSMKDAQAMHKRMADFYAGVEKVYKSGGAEADVLKQVSLNDWQKLKHFDEQMGGNINKVWLEVEPANF